MKKDQSSFCQRIRVSIHHAEPLLALGLAAALEDSSIEVTLAGNGSQPGGDEVLICDPERGLTLLGEASRRARILIVAVTLNEAEIQAALKAGAHGYVLLNGGPSQLKEVVSTVARGSRYLCPLVANHLATSLSYLALTDRELDVLRLLVRGKPNKAIGNSLAISTGTVKTHVKSIMGKLRVQSRTEAASLALERGLVCRSGIGSGGYSAPKLLQMASAAIPTHRDAAAGRPSYDQFR